ncbi:putative LRR containing protein [Trachipleistophora hominis]|uniref:Putative LRR containing protein n=1 Tax=Trachipleistophora hominis TaxID=72359 RepID=L7JYE5_TRAHO|nr:putative LRR containing protein [Trachipleistophora hominis]
MLVNFYEYATNAVLYILVFKSVQRMNLNEYVALSDLSITNMSKFLTDLADNKTKCPYYSVHVYKYEQQAEDFSAMSTNVCSYSVKQALNVDRNDLRRYIEVLRTETRTRTFKIIEFEFSKTLFIKIMSLSMYTTTFFTQYEIHHIFKYIFLHMDDLALLAFSVCISLQNDPQIFYSLSDYTKKYKHLICSYQPCAFKCHHDYSNALMKFREVVNHKVELTLVEGDVARAKVYGHKQHSTILKSIVPLNEFKLGFLFECCDTKFTQVADLDILYDKFIYNGYNSRLTIIILENLTVENIFDIIVGTEDVMLKVPWFPSHKLWAQKHIERVTFRLHIYSSSDSSLISSHIKLLKHIRFASLMIDFVNSVPQPIYNVGICFLRYINAYVYNLPENVSTIICEHINFDYDFLFTKRFKSVSICDSVVEQGKTVTIEKGCETVTIINSRGQFDLSNAAGFNKIVLLNSGSKLSFQEKKDNHFNYITITFAEINESTIIDGSFNEMIFRNIKFNKIVTLLISDGAKHVSIYKTSGSLNFVGDFRGIVSFFSDSFLVITHKENEPRNISLFSCGVTDSLEFKNIYHSIVLSYMNLSDNFCFAMDETCKELSIDNCHGTYNLSKAGVLEKLKIEFARETSDKMKIIGPVAVNNLDVLEIPFNINELSHFFDQFSRIKSLKLGTAYMPIWRVSLEQHFMCQYAAFFQLRGPINNIRGESSNFLAYQNLYSHENWAMHGDEIMASIFYRKVVTEIEALEYENILMTDNNCRYLQRMNNLKSLTASMHNLTGESFTHLPRNIQSLNLYGSYIPNNDYKQCLNILKCLPYLSILTLSGDFFADTSNFQLLPETVKTLVISYEKQDVRNSSINDKKISLHKLYVRVLWQSIFHEYTKILNVELIEYLQAIFVFVERYDLECLIVSTAIECFEIDPTTYGVIHSYNEQTCHGINF